MSESGYDWVRLRRGPWHREVHSPPRSLPDRPSLPLLLFRRDSVRRCVPGTPSPLSDSLRGWLSPAEPGCQQRLLAASISTYTVPNHIAMATDLIPLRNMRKQDMVEELERYGLASLTSTTNDIMLVVIKALREDMAVKKPPGLGKMLKKELLELCIEKGVEVDEKTVTCNEMRLLLQGVDVQGTIAEARRVVRRHQVGDASPATGSEPHSEPAGQFKSIKKS